MGIDLRQQFVQRTAGELSDDLLAARLLVLGRTMLRDSRELEMAMNSDFVSAKTAAERLSVSERSFQRWAQRVGIPLVRIGRLARYKWSDIESAVKKPVDTPTR